MLVNDTRSGSEQVRSGHLSSVVCLLTVSVVHPGLEDIKRVLLGLVPKTHCLVVATVGYQVLRVR